MQGRPKYGLLSNLTFQVIAAIVLGAVFGHVWPEWGKDMKPLADGFIKLIKMIIGPIVFLTIVTGISHMGDLKKVGRVGVKAIIYFEIVTTIALIMGMAVMNWLEPGVGFDTVHADKVDVSKYVAAAKESSEHSAVEFILGVIPDNFVGAFASGDLLQVLFVAVLFGAALAAMGDHGKAVEELCEKVATAFFGVIHIIMKIAPFAAFGAMAFTIGTYGLAALIPLGKLLLLAIATLLIFIVVVLGTICRYYRISLWNFIRYIREELLIVLGTSSSETVLPRMMQKLQRLGCSKPVVGLVLPTGYSFNLDGSSLYLSMCVLFIAQAYGIHLDFTQQLSILGIMLLTSKGAAGVVGSAFIALAATVAATGILPLEGLALLLGIDRFMSTARALTNLIGNGVATIVIAKMENEYDEQQAAEEYGRVLGKTA